MRLVQQEAHHLFLGDLRQQSGAGLLAGVVFLDHLEGRIGHLGDLLEAAVDLAVLDGDPFLAADRLEQQRPLHLADRRGSR